MLKRLGDRFWVILCGVLIVGIFWFNISSAVDVSSGVVFGDALGYWRSRDLGSFSNLVYGDGSESFRQLVVGFENPEIVESVLTGVITGDITHSIVSVDAVEDLAVVKVVIRNRNLESILTKFMSTYFEKIQEKMASGQELSEEEFNTLAKALLNESLVNQETEKAYFVLDVLLKRVNGEWRIVMNSELLDALTGNYYSFHKRMSGE